MRLTLRTLLAYLDDVLEPAQAHEIGQKVAESSVANSLVTKIREVLRRRRLTAPALSGPGAGIDPNAVAEYLDSTLSQDAVADVEKICLESDVHLAEVAACHQILPLVLGERVDIPPRLRERMYGLGPSVSRVEIVGAPSPLDLEVGELSPDSVAGILAQAPVAPRPQAIGPKPVPVPKPAPDALPEYPLPQRSVGKLLGYAAALIILLGWGMLTFNNSPFRSEKSRETPNENDSNPSREIADADDQDAGAAPNSNSHASQDPTTAPGAGGARPQGVDRNSDLSGNDGRRQRSTEASASRPSSKVKPPTEIGLDAGEVDALGDDLDDAAPPYRKKGRAASDAAANRRITSSENNEEESAATEPAAVRPPKSVGRYVSSEGVALWFTPEDEGWNMIPAGSQLYSGTDIATPAPFEATVEFDGGLATLLPATRVVWLGESAGVPIGFQLRQGRVVLRSQSAGQARAEPLIAGAELAGVWWRIELSPDAICGLESTPPLPSRFEQGATTQGGLASLHIASGTAKLIQTGDFEFAIELKGPASLSVPVAQPTEIPHRPRPDVTWRSPEWMSPSRTAGAGKSLSAIFQKDFSPKQPVELTIPAVASAPNPRISELATSCLSLIGDARSLLAILHTTKHEESRQAAVLGLRAWLLADESNRELLKTELARRYPASEAEIVYQLLWGYRLVDAQTKSTSSLLIDWMGHRDTSIRALAFHHVRSLTGRDFGYHANGSDLQRTSALKQWRQHLNRNSGCLIKPKAEGDSVEDGDATQ